jgi:hypothetical protein
VALPRMERVALLRVVVCNNIFGDISIHHVNTDSGAHSAS